jgi:hypothetical protein
VAAIAAYFEKKGIPTVVEVSDLANIRKIAKDTYLANGVPELRSVFVPPSKWVERCPEEHLPKFLEALTAPLTEAEKKGGRYTPPTSPRIAMTGTYDEVQQFFTGDLSLFVDSPPTARWTDGLPVSPPTPEAVARMLKGTSHKPDEIVNPRMGPLNRIVTVEKVAINAVMAGCQPEQLPLCLAITEGGLKNAYGSSGSMGIVHVVSGPVVRQLGMNAGIAVLSAGNPANATLSRFTALVLRNLAGVVPGITNIEAYGTPFMGLTIPESPESPWEGINVRMGYSPKESIVLQLNSKIAIVGNGAGEVTLLSEKATAPTQLVQAMKAFLPVMGSTGRIIIVNPEVARSWKEKFGWDTMAKLQDFLWDNVTWPRKNYDLSYWWGTREPFKDYVAALSSERGSRTLNAEHVEMAPDAMVPINASPKQFIVVVAGGGAPNYNEFQPAFAWGTFGACTVLPIAKWR